MRRASGPSWKVFSGGSALYSAIFVFFSLLLLNDLRGSKLMGYHLLNHSEIIHVRGVCSIRGPYHRPSRAKTLNRAHEHFLGADLREKSRSLIGEKERKTVSWNRNTIGRIEETGIRNARGNGLIQTTRRYLPPNGRSGWRNEEGTEPQNQH